jgi:titin
MALARTLRTAGIAVAASSMLVFGFVAPAQAEVPAAPTALRATPEENPIDPGQPLIRLRWRPPANADGVTGFRVYVDGTLLETVRAKSCPTPTATRRVEWCANVTNLVIGQIYTFGVTAVSKGGESKVVTTKRMAVIAPTEPLNLQVVPDQQSLYVSWDPPLNTGGGPIRSYIVRVNSALPGPQPACERITETSCKIEGLLNGYHHDVTVEARNSGGAFLPGPESLPAIGIPNARPSGPRDFRVVSAGSTTATIAWEVPEHVGNEPILGYTISLFNNEGYWFPNQRPEYPQISVGPDVRRYRLTGLKPGLEYQFAVQAYTKLSPGAMTVNTLHNPLGLPGKPALVEITGSGNTTVNLTWEDADPNGGVEPTHYRLIATPVNAPAGVFVEDITCPVKATQDVPDFECAGEYLWMRLVNGATYSFTVAAKNKFGWGPTSNYPAFATPEGPPPPPVIDKATITSGSSITLEWLPSVTAGGPDVGAVTYTVTLDGTPVCRDISTTSCALTGLTFGDDYAVKVMAINEVFGGDDFSSSTLIVNTNPIQVGTP